MNHDFSYLTLIFIGTKLVDREGAKSSNFRFQDILKHNFIFHNMEGGLWKQEEKKRISF